MELDAYAADPKGLRAKLAAIDPHAIWVTGGNTFYLRHCMRASGFDGLAQELCGPRRAATVPAQRAVVYVGQSAGAICGGASVDTAHFKGWWAGD